MSEGTLSILSQSLLTFLVSRNSALCLLLCNHSNLFWVTVNGHYFVIIHVSWIRLCFRLSSISTYNRFCFCLCPSPWDFYKADLVAFSIISFFIWQRIVPHSLHFNPPIPGSHSLGHLLWHLSQCATFHYTPQMKAGRLSSTSRTIFPKSMLITINRSTDSFLLQVVNLKEARDFSADKEFIYVFKVILSS